MDIQFVGEHLLPGKLGQFFVVLSFCSALLSAISYYFAAVKDTLDNSWRNIGRLGLWINTVSVIGIGCCLFYIIYNHYFEYHYAWAHSSRTLPVHYIISCFWEGQEGSFWLWTFWQAVLANIVILRARSWESPVMSIIMLSQVFLGSMILGVDILGARIGSSPFILLRDALEAPIFSRPDYLGLIQDGNGLNPLLQNYWMVIHPPTLFLGFASMIVPFAYALAGLWQGRFKEWTAPALPWSLFAVMILGAGIVMGSFWAYEALNFGGFWAWDPVENASIIPWLTLIAAVHVMLAYKHSGHSYFTSTFLVLISFVLVLYASFLTRSGVLGETSVHSFTDLGMFWHLVVYILVFLALMVIALVSRRKEMPVSKKEEETYSREFWLFIGAIVLSVACIQILGTTSVPVFNKAFGTKIAPPVDVVQHYNKLQAPFALVIAILAGFSQLLKYRQTKAQYFLKSLLINLAISAVVAGIFVYITGVYTSPMYILIIFAGTFAVICNGGLLLNALRGKWKLTGSAIAHIGFGLLLVGALVAAATNKVISVNSSGRIPVAGFEQAEKPGDNLMLYQNKPAKMGDFEITYLSDSTVGANTYYRINYKEIDQKTGKVKGSFDLHPNAQQNPKMGLVASPDTKHYFTYDVYTHVTAAPKVEQESADEHGHDHGDHADDKKYGDPATYEVSVGDTVRLKTGFIVVKAVNKNAKIAQIPLTKGDVAVAMDLDVNVSGRVYQAQPLFLIKGNNTFDFGKELAEPGLKLRFSNIYPEKKKFELIVFQKPEPEQKWVVLKAIRFPYINLFWSGAILMVLGFLLSIWQRVKELKRKGTAVRSATMAE